MRAAVAEAKAEGTKAAVTSMNVLNYEVDAIFGCVCGCEDASNDCELFRSFCCVAHHKSLPQQPDAWVSCPESTNMVPCLMLTPQLPLVAPQWSIHCSGPNNE